jgi:hypothetical protein
MKLGEIKLEALKIMNINNDSVLVLENMDAILGEKRYAKYLNNMFNCINKAIDIINRKKILPQNRIEMSELEVKQGAINNRFDISSISDFMSISRIVYEDSNGYRERIPFEREGNFVVVSNKYLPEYLAMVYNTKIDNITDNIAATDDVPNLSDELARLIPYYIKFELYQEDEPDLALTAKNTFDQGIESLRVYDDEFESFNIEKVYSSEGY